MLNVCMEELDYISNKIFKKSLISYWRKERVNDIFILTRSTGTIFEKKQGRKIDKTASLSKSDKLEEFLEY